MTDQALKILLMFLKNGMIWDQRNEKNVVSLGHEFVMSSDAMMSAKAMSQNFIDHMDTAFDKWTPRKRYTIFEG